jgi:hypothetical protein
MREVTLVERGIGLRSCAEIENSAVSIRRECAVEELNKLVEDDALTH